QVHDRHVSLFLDGLEEDGTPFDTQVLSTRMSDRSEDGAAMWVGLSSNGSNQFIGWMRDFRFYPATLSNREIMEVYSGVLPKLHAQSECRCPQTHPRVHPLIERYCISNGVEDTTNDRVLRLNLNAHPLSYMNDQDMGTSWISKIMSPQELDEGVTITLDLANGQYQVFHVIVQFGGLLPETVLIQRRKLDLADLDSDARSEQPWLDWQYMARNCSVFEMQNNGPLLKPDSVNCMQLPKDVPFSGGNITFSLLTPEPNPRPGYNDFYNNPALQKMVHATWVRIHLSGQYHTRETTVSLRHRYYAIKEITISGRCECHGHANHCDTSGTAYRCLCAPESHTEGDNEHVEGHSCDTCHRGYHTLERRNSLGCLPCVCDIYGTVPGGVCDEWTGQCPCREGVEGSQCTNCAPNYYNRSGNSREERFWSCVPCVCDPKGTVPWSVCDTTTGQCVCIPTHHGQDCSGCRTVGGQHCDQCHDMFYGFNPGLGRCQPCTCDLMGSVNGSCHPDSGVCSCKLLVVHRMKPSAQSVYVVEGLKPYNMYNFTVTVCTKTGCITSLPGAGRTLPAGIGLSFKTRSTDGLLLAAFSPGNQEEFLAIQIKDGRPYFLFDPQVRRLLTLLRNVRVKSFEISYTHACTDLHTHAHTHTHTHTHTRAIDVSNCIGIYAAFIYFNHLTNWLTFTSLFIFSFGVLPPLPFSPFLSPPSFPMKPPFSLSIAPI
ncbi:unnamed protein product, partial [Tetraodon nigroviridis]